MAAPCQHGKNSMKVVMLAQLYDERLQFQENLLGKYYAMNGHEVTVIAASVKDAIDSYADRYERGGPRTEYWDGAVKVIKLPYAINIMNRVWWFGGVAAILERERPDLIFVHNVHFNLREAVAYKRRHEGCRLVMDCHSDYSNSAKNWVSLRILNGLIRRTFLQWHARHVDRFYPVVPESAVFLNEVFGVPRSRMELLPLGADMELARRTRAERAGEKTREQFGIGEGALVVFTGGKLMPAKNTHLVVSAVANCEAADVHLIVVGEAMAGQALYKQQLLDAAGGSPKIHFVGWVDAADVYRFIDAADLAVFPGSQSVLWQQAISMGLPLIVAAETDRARQDPSYLNLHGNMIILAKHDIVVDVIRSHILRLAANRKLLRDLSLAAERTASELLDYNRIVVRTFG